MNQTKPNVISFKGTDQTKKEIETAAANLGMTSSELIRTAIEQYTAQRSDEGDHRDRETDGRNDPIWNENVGKSRDHARGYFQTVC